MTKPNYIGIFNMFRDLIMGVTSTKKDIQENDPNKNSKWIFGPWNQ